MRRPLTIAYVVYILVLLGVMVLDSGAAVKAIHDHSGTSPLAATRIWGAGASAVPGWHPAGGENGVPFSAGLRIVLGNAADDVVVHFSED